MDEFIKWFGFIGSVASLVGLPIAIWQIYKTRRVAEAARNAALQTQKTISRNLLISDVSTCVKHIEEIKSFVRTENYELALVRINDLVSQLMQIQETDFKEIILKLSSIRNNFERKLEKSSAKIKIAEVNSQLALISDDFNRLIGETKFTIQKGEQNG
ncbi:MAG: hypothetical protein ACR2HG_14510 [Pyrinomonadaceae bacterium]